MTSGKEQKRNRNITMCVITRGYELTILKLLRTYSGMEHMEQMDSGCWEPGFSLLERKITDKQGGKLE